MPRFLSYLLLISLLAGARPAGASTIHFQADSDIREAPCFKQAMHDLTALLEAHTDTRVDTFGLYADYQILLIKDMNFAARGNFDSLSGKGAYRWEFIDTTGILNIYLRADSYKGFANGLYALLQEKLGFQFYHPRGMLTQATRTIDWGSIPSFQGKPVFEKMGFHLHTMHPLELTESLLDESSPDALNRVKEYIDWLARNGQNYFEFNLLESIDRDTWIAHAKQITEYAHSRDIWCGIDLSLHMIQQKAFQLYTGKLNKAEKIKKNAEWLLAAGFDLWNVELSTTEFSQGDQEEKKILLGILGDILRQHGVKLMSRCHVVKADKMVSGSEVVTNEHILAPDHGLMVHSVMFYSLNDSSAPVYENKNLWHMRDILLAEKEKRETWYYPESAYWITFDNSVPMFLLPYLSARLDDINYCEAQQIPGHLTFSSGWEWGYWLIDWSIARWSWDYYENGEKKEKKPLQYIEAVASNQTFIEYLNSSAELQQSYIKDEELIRVLVAHTITDEIPGKFNLELHPRPKYMYTYIRNEASLDELQYVETQYLEKLHTYINLQEQLSATGNTKTSYNEIERELHDGIRITWLRAKHRYQTLSYLVATRKNKLNKTSVDPAAFLAEAAKIRQEALEIVRERETHYRYPLALLSGHYESKTAYHHGYLMTTHELHFWKREEEQALKNKYKFWFMNIWNIARIIGLIN